jgi:hypothetical protein
LTHDLLQRYFWFRSLLPPLEYWVFEMRGGVDHLVRFVDPPPHELAYFHSLSRPVAAAVAFAVVSPHDVLFVVFFFHLELPQVHHTLASDVDDLAFGMLFYNIGWFDIFHIERAW